MPLAEAGSPNKLSAISGRVGGAHPDQQIVLYAKAQGTWWVQPFANQPFTKIQPDSKWRSSIHPGVEYAALLVGPEFRPPATADVLPTEGVIASALTKGTPPVWQRWWFLLACAFVASSGVFGVHRFRLAQATNQLKFRFEERLAERMRVAQMLHDTLLQGVISASMQLHVAVDQLPSGSPTLEPLHRVLQSMGRVVEEGRNTLRGLRSPIESAHDLEHSFSGIPQELNIQEEVGFRVTVKGPSRPLRSTVRVGLYNIGREALVNAFRHSQGRNIEAELRYTASEFRLLVRDDGCGMDPHLLRSGREGHGGLPRMREQAERIGARLTVSSRKGSGTKVELRVPRRIAFESHPSDRASGWFSGFYRRWVEPKDPNGKS